MNLGETFITIFVIVLVSAILFIFPLMIISNQVDSASQISLQTYLTDFINEICDTGKITKTSYDKFIERITGPNVYNVEIELKILDNNPNKKTTADNSTKLGEDVYVTYYTSQIVQQLDDKNFDGCVFLKEGDQVHVYIANTNTTILQQLSITPKSDLPTIVAESTQTCTVNGM